jgi:hypothetical protein
MHDASLFNRHADWDVINWPWMAASDDKLAIYRMNERKRWALQRAAEAEVFFPFLIFHPVFLERIQYFFEFLRHIVILICCILAFVYLLHCTNEDEMKQIHEFQHARRELGLRLSKSIHEYTEAAAPVL